MHRKAIALAISMLALTVLLASPAMAGSRPVSTMPTRQPVGEPTPEQIVMSDLKAQQVAIRLHWTAGALGPGEAGVMVSDPPNTMTLSIANYIAQPDGTTCGPTSAHNLLLNWGYDVSIDHLKTDLGWTTNGTPLDADWPTTLNSHSGSSYYVIGWSPSETTTWAAFVGDTLDYHPFILLVLMNDSRGYLVGYPHDREWGHYVTGNGYSGYRLGTKYGKYFDQYNGLANTYGEHSVELSTWVTMLDQNGIVW